MKTDLTSYAAVSSDNQNNEDQQPVMVYGTVTKLENNQIQLNNSNSNAQFSEIILNIPQGTRILDAVNGFPMSLDSIKDGQTLYAYIGNAVTLSLPPIGNAVLVLGNIPADYRVPSYHKIKSCALSEGEVYQLHTTDGSIFTIDNTTTLLPYLTRNIVNAQDLVADKYVLVWSNDTNLKKAAKVVLFPNDSDRSQEGWLQENGVWKFIQNGQPITNDWYQDANGKWYFFNSEGGMNTGWNKYKENWYYFNTDNGFMVTGFLNVDGKTYYLESDGKLLTKPKTFTPNEDGVLN